MHVAEVDVRGVHRQHTTASLFRGDPLQHPAVQRLAHFTLQTRQGVKGRIARPEEQEPARLHPVRLGAAVQLDDAVDGCIVAEEGERSDQRARADTGDRIELRARQCTGDASPPLEHPGTERAPVPAAGDDQYINGHLWRRLGALRRSVNFGLDTRHSLLHDLVRLVRLRDVIDTTSSAQVFQGPVWSLYRGTADAHRSGDQDRREQP
jgi:hypothetical protein